MQLCIRISIRNFFVWLQLEHRETNIRQFEAEFAQLRHQYKETIGENGRLEARIQAFTYNAENEKDVLSMEVKRREDAIEKLKKQQIQLQDTISKQEEKVFHIVPSWGWS